MKTKIFYPYVIIEFALFIASYFFAVNPAIDFNYKILITIGFSINIPFTLFMVPKEKMDRYFALIYAIFVFSGELILTITNQYVISLILFLLGFIAISVRLFMLVNDDNRMKKAAVISLLGLTFVSLVLLLLKVISFEYFIFLLVIIISILNIVLMIHRYKNGNILHKPNWFFGGSGFVFYMIYLACSTFGPLMDDTAALKSMISLGSAVLLIPSILMILLSFMLFEQREA